MFLTPPNPPFDKASIEKVSLDYFNNIPNSGYVKNAGEHYRLLTHISNQFNGITIIDAGTYNGFSALALAQNKVNKITTYDIEKKDIPFFKDYPNIEFKVMDINEESTDIINSAHLILLDVDPHDGIQEAMFYAYLQMMHFKGYLLCDDIHLNPGMEKFWNSITEHRKYDITAVGHHSGTGLVLFE